MKKRKIGILGTLVVLLMVLLLTVPVSAKAKGKSLLVGPGQEYETIQAAVDAAKKGSKILVYPDTYVEAVSVTKNDLQIIAKGDGVIVQPPGQPAGFQVFADHVTIRGFEIAYGRDGAPGISFEGSHNNFEDNFIYLDASWPGVNALVCRDTDGGSDFNTIKGNTIHQADLAIIIRAETKDAINRGNIIRDNTLEDIAQTPIGVEGGKGFLISGNSISGAPFGHCIAIGTGFGNTIAQGRHTVTNNTMGHCAGNGISLYAEPGGTLNHNRILRNTIQDCGEDCLSLEAGEGASVSHNHLRDNSASFSAICGIELGAEPWDAAGASVSDNLVQSNTVYRNLSGICLNPGADKNQVRNNVAQDHTADGIVVFGDENKLKNNDIHDNDDNGIEVAGDNNKIIKNTALRSGVLDLADEGTGNRWRNNTYDTASWE